MSNKTAFSFSFIFWKMYYVVYGFIIRPAIFGNWAVRLPEKIYGRKDRDKKREKKIIGADTFASFRETGKSLCLKEGTPSSTGGTGFCKAVKSPCLKGGAPSSRGACVSAKQLSRPV
ncbi:hypothetical protein [Bacteroides pyogenes]|uniref:hypothetical protein n=1 Tax=Bacteroides pyogenes TaxID=310300 RepID=UPI0011E40C6A|nr:hypothetical protein [Bacteroides pyogenes]MCE9105914.1 hypothetical protein [Bacteroides pyogenes]TYK35778.1 hypothetical protein FNJ61_09620 [Bacteroides pyogenes]